MVSIKIQRFLKHLKKGLFAGASFPHFDGFEIVHISTRGRGCEPLPDE